MRKLLYPYLSCALRSVNTFNPSSVKGNNCPRLLDGENQGSEMYGDLRPVEKMARANVVLKPAPDCLRAGPSEPPLSPEGPVPPGWVKDWSLEPHAPREAKATFQNQKQNRIKL